MTIERSGLDEGREGYYFVDHRSTWGLKLDTNKLELILRDLEDAKQAPKYEDCVPWLAATGSFGASAVNIFLSSGNVWAFAIFVAFGASTLGFSINTWLKAYRCRDLRNVTAKTMADKYRLPF